MYRSLSVCRRSAFITATALKRSWGTIRGNKLSAFAVSSCHHNIIANQRYSSTFVPPPNNTYHGETVYKDIDITSQPITSAANARNNDPKAVFVVTGASRSMGLQFVKELLSRTKGHVIACVLRPGSSPALDSYLNGLDREERTRVCVRGLNVADESQIEALVKDISEDERYGRVEGYSM